MFDILARVKNLNARFLTVSFTHSTVSSQHLNHFLTPLHCHCKYPTAEMAVVRGSVVPSRLMSQAVQRGARNRWAGWVTAAKGGTVRGEKEGETESNHGLGGLEYTGLQKLEDPINVNLS